jgi:hypothetical protein
MSTAPTRSRVARAGVALLGALALGGCATRAAAPAAGPTVAASQPTILAENGGGDWVDVYLIHDLGEWHLGRLAPGAKMPLPLPPSFRASPTGLVRLAALAGTTRSSRPSRDPRAFVTMAQPVTAVLGQRWTFVHGQLTGLRVHPR